MHLICQNKFILQKIETFVNDQLAKMTAVFKFESIEETEEIQIFVEYGDCSDYFKDFDECV